MDERQNAYRERAPANDERECLETSTPFEPPIIRPGDLLSKDANGLPYRFEDEPIHAVVGARLAPADTKTFSM